MEDKYYVGIDLGLKGGIVVLKNNKLIFKCIMPLIGGDLDLMRIATILNKYRKKNTHVVLERFAGFFGYSKKAATSLSKQSGKIEGILAVLRIPYTAVLPQTWQKVIWVGTKIQFKKSKGKQVKDTKKTSLLTVTRLFPNESFLASTRCTVPHDGLVDAVLLAEFGRRKGF